MKTVWHWDEIVKGGAIALGSSLIWSIFCSAFDIPATITGAVGLLLGAAVYIACSMWWDFYHFK